MWTERYASFRSMHVIKSHKSLQTGNVLHFKMKVLYKPVELAEVDRWMVSSLLFWDEEQSVVEIFF